MDINQLQYFKKIAETGSLTKAAEQLHISQPAMSAVLKKIEAELHVELFDRSANRIQLNQLGETALIHVNNILRDYEQMKKDLLSLSQQKLSISFGFCDPGVQWYCVPRFSYAHPEINVSEELYQTHDVVRMLLDRTYDVIIVPHKVIHSDICCKSFLKDEVFLSVPTGSKLAERKSVSLREIPAQPLLLPDIGGYFVKQIEKIIIQEKLPITLVKNEFMITQHLIRTTNFLTTVSLLSKELRNDGTNRLLVPFSDTELKVQYFIAYHQANRQKANSFLDWVKSCHN